MAKAVKSQLAEFAREILGRPRTNVKAQSLTKNARRQQIESGVGDAPVAVQDFHASALQMPLGLEGAPGVDLEDDFWLRSFVEDPLDLSFIGQSHGQS